MKNLKLFVLALGLSVFAMPALANNWHSTISDTEAGVAVNVVETDNVIHVYVYTGASSEASAGSTFDAGEDWTNFTWEPRVISSPVQHQRNLQPEGGYIRMVDNCTSSGGTWHFPTESCSQ